MQRGAAVWVVGVFERLPCLDRADAATAEAGTAAVGMAVEIGAAGEVMAVGVVRTKCMT